MTTLFTFNTIRNEYQLTIPTAKLQIAAAWLRSKGCKFTTVSDRTFKTTVVRFNKIEQQWAAALSAKHGRKDAATPKTAATSPRVRKAWVAPVEAPVAPVHTASQLAEPAMPDAVTETIGKTPLYLSPAFATKSQLLALSKTRLKKLAGHYNVKGRSKMDATQLSETLLGLVKKSDIK